MPNPGHDPETLLRTLQAASEHKTQKDAAEALGVNYTTFRSRLQVAQATFKDWTPEDAGTPAGKPVEEVPLAERQRRRLLDDKAALKRELNAANRELNAIEDFRDQIFGMGEPIDPIDHPIVFKGGEPDAAEIPLLFQSDEQWGEVIKREEMGGLNSYNRNIASDRYKRLIESTIKCCQPPYAPNSPPELVYCMGGDSISGSIHEELAETNDLSSIPAVRDYCAHVRWGIETLRDALKCPIRVVRVPGNHDRTTRKPRHKGYVETSFDTIISWHLEMCFKDDPDVQFFLPPENDALFEIYGFKFLLTHGDMMGTGGGTGYIGPVAPITKGHRKLVETYMQANKRVDYVLTGHFHTAVETEYGWGNGCIPGFSEYARLKIRAKPSPPVQWLLSVHPERGVTTRRQINLAHPDEGDLYHHEEQA